MEFLSSFRRTLMRKFREVGTNAPCAQSAEDSVIGIAGPHSPCAALPGACDWQDHLVTGLNKLGAHAPLLALSNEAEACVAELERGVVDSRFRRVLTPPGTRWKFFMSATPEQTPEIVPGVGFARSEEWTDTIDVPRSIECTEPTRFGQPFYTNFVYPFACDPPRIPSAINYVGCYQESIRVPREWRGRRVFLYFEGAGAALECWLDGAFVGYSQDSFLPAEFEITAHVHPKMLAVGDGEADLDSLEMSLSVKCYRFCDGSYMESQDMWWMSGIHRQVIIYSKPASATLWDFKVETCLLATSRQESRDAGGGAQQQPARVCVEVEVRQLESSVCSALSWKEAGDSSLKDVCRLAENVFDSDKSLSVRVSLYGPHRLLAGESSTIPQDLEPVARATVPLTPAGSVGKKMNPGKEDEGARGGHPAPEAFMERVLLGCATLNLGGPGLKPVEYWSPDSPWLYTLVMALTNGEDEVVDVEVSRVGVRELCVRDGCLLSNGSVVEVRGVNRHEHDHRLGKHVTRDSMIEDIVQIKRLNMNAVRAAHYPNANLWYTLCDAYGLWVCDEANIETHGIVTDKDEAFLADHAEWREPFLERLTRMVRRDRHHACILMWSLGNESSYGANHDRMYQWLKLQDPSRPVQYESCGGASATDIICPMYIPPAQLEKLICVSEQNKRNLQLGRRWPEGSHKAVRPVILCEYAHAMNNSVGNFDEYWRIIRRHACLQGGFIWDWMDQGLLQTGVGGDTYWAYGGDFGEHVHDAMWLINGLTFPDREWHPSCFQVRKTLSPVFININVSHKKDDCNVWEGILATVTFRNGYEARTLEGLGWQWSVEKDGLLVCESALRAFPPVIPSGRSSWEKTCSLGAGLDEWSRKPTEFGDLIEVGVGELGELGDMQAELEVSLTVTVRLLGAETWAPSGYEIAFEQVVFPVKGILQDLPRPESPSPVEHSAIHMQEDSDGGAQDGGLRVQSCSERLVVVGPNGLRVAWGKRSGELLSYCWGGMQLVGWSGDGDDCGEEAEGRTRTRGMRQIFWRAHTDNDNGGPDTLDRFGATRQSYPPHCGHGTSTPRVRGAMAFGLWYSHAVNSFTHTSTRACLPAPAEARDRALMQKVCTSTIIRWMDQWGDTSYGRMWDKLGLARLKATDACAEVMRTQHQEGGGLKAVDVRCKYTLVSDQGACIQCESVYSVDAAGELQVRNKSEIPASMPPLPRVGMQLTLNPGLQRLVYYGCGPFETYPDRCSGAKIGRYECSVDDTYVPYIVPSDNGLRTRVRWAALTNTDGKGLLVSGGGEAGGEELCVSAHRFTAHDLHKAMHTCDLKPREEITLTLDHRHMPCGGNDSWSRAHLPDYLIAAGTYSYSIRLRPITSAAEISRPPPPRTALLPAAFTPPPPMIALANGCVRSFRAFMATLPVLLAERIVHATSQLAKIPRYALVIVVSALVLAVVISAVVLRR